MTDDHKAEALREALTNIIRTIDLSSDENLSPATYRATLASAILARFNVTERDEDTSRYRAVNLATGQRTPSWEPGERAQISDWTLWREERFNSATSEWEAFDE